MSVEKAELLHRAKNLMEYTKLDWHHEHESMSFYNLRYYSEKLEMVDEKSNTT